MSHPDPVVVDDPRQIDYNEPILTLHAFRFYRTQVLPPADHLPTAEEWAATMNSLETLEDNNSWWFGGHAQIGQERYPEAYDQYLTPARRAKLKVIFWVMERFPSHRRRFNVSFTHYREVMGLNDDQLQDDLLRQAEEEHWTCNELRRRVTKIRKAHQIEPTEEKFAQAEEGVLLGVTANTVTLQVPFFVAERLRNLPDHTVLTFSLSRTLNPVEQTECSACGATCQHIPDEHLPPGWTAWRCPTCQTVRQRPPLEYLNTPIPIGEPDRQPAGGEQDSDPRQVRRVRAAV